MHDRKNMQKKTIQNEQVKTIQKERIKTIQNERVKTIVFPLFLRIKILQI